MTDISPSFDRLTDAVLVLHVRLGQQAAFDALYRRHFASLVRFVWSRVPDGQHTNVMDAAQEAFTTAYERINTIRDPHLFWPWLCGIARNTAASAYRRSREVLVDSYPDTATSEYDGPEEVVMARVTIEEILAGAPAWGRPLATMLAGGMPSHEVADAMGLHCRTVLNLRRQLRKYALRGSATTHPGRIDRRRPAPGERQLQRALEQLTERQHEVLMLSAEGWKPSIIASMLGTTANSARVSLCTARKSVTTLLGCDVTTLNRRLLALHDFKMPALRGLLARPGDLPASGAGQVADDERGAAHDRDSWGSGRGGRC